MKRILAFLFLAFALQTDAATLTATENFSASSVTFKVEGVSVFYYYIPSSGIHTINGVEYGKTKKTRGPAWVKEEGGGQAFSKGYSIEVAGFLWSSIIWNLNNVSASFSCPVDFVAYWESLGGTIVGTIEGDCY